MRHILNIKITFFLSSFVLLVFSCKKIDQVDPIGDAGITYVKIIGGGNSPELVKRAIDFVSTPSTISLNIQRLVANQVDLDKKMTIKILDDTTAVNFFNRDTVSTNPNATNPSKLFFEHLPPTWYTVAVTSTKSGGSGGVYTLVMNPSEFAKDLGIVIPNATLLNPSSTYALAFKIFSVDADGKIADSRSAIMTIGAKNSYDGVYKVTGNFVDVTNATFTARYPLEYHLVTTGPNSVDVKLNNINGDIIPGYLFNAGSAGSFFGNWGLTMTFDPITNLVSDLHNYYGDPSKAATSVGNPALGTGAPNFAATNTRRAVLDPSGLNSFTPSTRQVQIKYFMIQTSSAAGSSPRCKFDENWTYIGPRP